MQYYCLLVQLPEVEILGLPSPLLPTHVGRTQFVDPLPPEYHVDCTALICACVKVSCVNIGLCYSIMYYRIMCYGIMCYSIKLPLGWLVGLAHGLSLVIILKFQSLSRFIIKRV